MQNNISILDEKKVSKQDRNSEAIKEKTDRLNYKKINKVCRIIENAKKKKKLKSQL